AGMRFRLALPSLAVVLLLTGCGGGDESTRTTTVLRATTQPPTSSVPEEAPAVVTLYFLRKGKVAPVERGIVTGPAIGTATIRELLKGPSSEDEGLGTAIPSGAKLEWLEIGNGVGASGPSPP